ncbi:MAG TPA: hypothetical protein VH277_20355 [Gemmatimonadaceae bacterium]|jgi:hypothetical protein|nr:hypothetical protein [Gemmatimonadaceae bacterium]
MIAAVLLAAIPALLQSPDTAVSCNGRRVSAISIDAQRPAFQGSASKWRRIAHALGLHHVTTRGDVIRDFSYVHVGDMCSDLQLSETARVLRSLPFLANASVQVVPAADGGVNVDIETTDEVPVLVGGALHHSVPAAFSIGNENLFGSGTTVAVGGASNSPFRSSFFARVASYGQFGPLTYTTIDAAREHLGDHVQLGVSRLLLSDLQRLAWNASYRGGNDFPIIVRPVGDDQSVPVRDRRWSIGAIIKTDFARTPILFGPVALGNSISPTNMSIVVTDSGAVTQRDSALLARFQPFHATRIGALLGARRVRFVTRIGFDALFAPQDLMVGWQIGTLAAPGFAHGDGHDFMLAPSVYLGTSTAHAAVFADGEGEMSKNFVGRGASTIANVHGIAYLKPTERFLLKAEDNFSIIDGAAVPTQLAMSDPLGGPRGFAGSTLVGAHRDVLRLEARLAYPAAIHQTDLGFALFADGGWLGAGNVPYGTSAARHSVGFSLIGSYPTRSKHTYRLDFAFPMGAGVSHGLQVRFVNGDPTSNFAIEPGDVTQARMAPVPSTMFTWPGR